MYRNLLLVGVLGAGSATGLAWATQIQESQCHKDDGTSRLAADTVGCLREESGQKSHSDEKDDADESIRLADAPPAVQDAIKKALGSHQLSMLSKEHEDGKVIYEAEYQDGTANITLSFSEDGKLLEEEREMDPAKLPAAVSNAVRSHYPDARISKAETSKTNDQLVYDVDIVLKEGNSHELTISEDGAILKDRKEEKERD